MTMQQNATVFVAFISCGNFIVKCDGRWIHVSLVMEAFGQLRDAGGNKQPSTLVMTGLHCLWHSNFYLTACGLLVIHLHTKVLTLPCTVALLIRSFIQFFYCSFLFFGGSIFISVQLCCDFDKTHDRKSFFFGNFVFIFIYFTHRLR